MFRFDLKYKEFDAFLKAYLTSGEEIKKDLITKIRKTLKNPKKAPSAVTALAQTLITQNAVALSGKCSTNEQTERVQNNFLTKVYCAYKWHLICKATEEKTNGAIYFDRLQEAVTGANVWTSALRENGSSNNLSAEKKQEALQKYTREFYACLLCEIAHPKKLRIELAENAEGIDPGERLAAKLNLTKIIELAQKADKYTITAQTVARALQISKEQAIEVVQKHLQSLENVKTTPSGQTALSALTGGLIKFILGTDKTEQERQEVIAGYYDRAQELFAHNQAFLETINNSFIAILVQLINEDTVAENTAIKYICETLFAQRERITASGAPINERSLGAVMPAAANKLLADFRQSNTATDYSASEAIYAAFNSCICAAEEMQQLIQNTEQNIERIRISCDKLLTAIGTTDLDADDRRARECITNARQYAENKYTEFEVALNAEQDNIDLEQIQTLAASIADIAATLGQTNSLVAAFVAPTIIDENAPSLSGMMKQNRSLVLALLEKYRPIEPGDAGDEPAPAAIQQRPISVSIPTSPLSNSGPRTDGLILEPTGKATPTPISVPTYEPEFVLPANAATSAPTKKRQTLDLSLDPLASLMDDSPTSRPPGPIAPTPRTTTTVDDEPWIDPDASLANLRKQLINKHHSQADIQPIFLGKFPQQEKDILHRCVAALIIPNGSHTDQGELKAVLIKIIRAYFAACGIPTERQREQLKEIFCKTYILFIGNGQNKDNKTAFTNAIVTLDIESSSTEDADRDQVFSTYIFEFYARILSNYYGDQRKNILEIFALATADKCNPSAELMQRAFALGNIQFAGLLRQYYTVFINIDHAETLAYLKLTIQQAVVFAFSQPDPQALLQVIYIYGRATFYSTDNQQVRETFIAALFKQIILSAPSLQDAEKCIIDFLFAYHAEIIQGNSALLESQITELSIMTAKLSGIKTLAYINDNELSTIIQHLEKQGNKITANELSTICAELNQLNNPFSPTQDEQNRVITKLGGLEPPSTLTKQQLPTVIRALSPYAKSVTISTTQLLTTFQELAVGSAYNDKVAQSIITYKLEAQLETKRQTIIKALETYDNDDGYRLRANIRAFATSSFALQLLTTTKTKIPEKYREKYEASLHEVRFPREITLPKLVNLLTDEPQAQIKRKHPKHSNKQQQLTNIVDELQSSGLISSTESMQPFFEQIPEDKLLQATRTLLTFLINQDVAAKKIEAALESETLETETQKETVTEASIATVTRAYVKYLLTHPNIVDQAGKLTTMYNYIVYRPDVIFNEKDTKQTDNFKRAFEDQLEQETPENNPTKQQFKATILRSINPDSAATPEDLPALDSDFFRSLATSSDGDDGNFDKLSVSDTDEIQEETPLVTKPKDEEENRKQKGKGKGKGKIAPITEEKQEPLIDITELEPKEEPQEKTTPKWGKQWDKVSILCTNNLGKKLLGAYSADPGNLDNFFKQNLHSESSAFAYNHTIINNCITALLNRKINAKDRVKTNELLTKIIQIYLVQTIEESARKDILTQLVNRHYALLDHHQGRELFISAVTITHQELSLAGNADSYPANYYHQKMCGLDAWEQEAYQLLQRANSEGLLLEPENLQTIFAAVEGAELAIKIRALIAEALINPTETILLKNIFTAYLNSIDTNHELEMRNLTTDLYDHNNLAKSEILIKTALEAYPQEFAQKANKDLFIINCKFEHYKNELLSLKKWNTDALPLLKVAQKDSTGLAGNSTQLTEEWELRAIFIKLESHELDTRVTELLQHAAQENENDLIKLIIKCYINITKDNQETFTQRTTSLFSVIYDPNKQDLSKIIINMHRRYLSTDEDSETIKQQYLTAYYASYFNNQHKNGKLSSEYHVYLAQARKTEHALKAATRGLVIFTCNSDLNTSKKRDILLAASAIVKNDKSAAAALHEQFAIENPDFSLNNDNDNAPLSTEKADITEHFISSLTTKTIQLQLLTKQLVIDVQKLKGELIESSSQLAPTTLCDIFHAIHLKKELSVEANKLLRTIFFNYGSICDLLLQINNTLKTHQNESACRRAYRALNEKFTAKDGFLLASWAGFDPHSLYPQSAFVKTSPNDVMDFLLLVLADLDETDTIWQNLPLLSTQIDCLRTMHRALLQHHHNTNTKTPEITAPTSRYVATLKNAQNLATQLPKTIKPDDKHKIALTLAISAKLGELKLCLTNKLEQCINPPIIPSKAASKTDNELQSTTNTAAEITLKIQLSNTTVEQIATLEEIQRRHTKSDAANNKQIARSVSVAMKTDNFGLLSLLESFQIQLLTIVNHIDVQEHIDYLNNLLTEETKYKTDLLARIQKKELQTDKQHDETMRRYSKKTLERFYSLQEKLSDPDWRLFETIINPDQKEYIYLAAVTEAMASPEDFKSFRDLIEAIKTTKRTHNLLELYKNINAILTIQIPEAMRGSLQEYTKGNYNTSVEIISKSYDKAFKLINEMLELLTMINIELPALLKQTKQNTNKPPIPNKHRGASLTTQQKVQKKKIKAISKPIPATNIERDESAKSIDDLLTKQTLTHTDIQAILIHTWEQLTNLMQLEGWYHDHIYKIAVKANPELLSTQQASEQSNSAHLKKQTSIMAEIDTLVTTTAERIKTKLNSERNIASTFISTINKQINSLNISSTNLSYTDLAIIQGSLSTPIQTTAEELKPSGRNEQILEHFKKSTEETQYKQNNEILFTKNICLLCDLILSIQNIPTNQHNNAYNTIEKAKTIINNLLSYFNSPFDTNTDTIRQKNNPSLKPIFDCYDNLKKTCDAFANSHPTAAKEENSLQKETQKKATETNPKPQFSPSSFFRTSKEKSPEFIPTTNLRAIAFPLQAPNICQGTSLLFNIVHIATKGNLLLLTDKDLKSILNGFMRIANEALPDALKKQPLPLGEAEGSQDAGFWPTPELLGTLSESTEEIMDSIHKHFVKPDDFKIKATESSLQISTANKVDTITKDHDDHITPKTEAEKKSAAEQITAILDSATNNCTPLTILTNGHVRAIGKKDQSYYLFDSRKLITDNEFTGLLQIGTKTQIIEQLAGTLASGELIQIQKLDIAETELTKQPQFNA